MAARVAYSEYPRWALDAVSAAAGQRHAHAQCPIPRPGDSYGPSFAPDGKTLVYSHGLDAGYGIESVDISRMCCAHELTHDAPAGG